MKETGAEVKKSTLAYRSQIIIIPGMQKNITSEYTQTNLDIRMSNMGDRSQNKHSDLTEIPIKWPSTPHRNPSRHDKRRNS
jgi:hypothetical protein